MNQTVVKTQWMVLSNTAVVEAKQREPAYGEEAGEHGDGDEQLRVNLGCQKHDHELFEGVSAYQSYTI